MKKILPILLLLTISSSLFGQSWLWGKQGKGSIKTNDDGSPVAIDKSGNVYLAGGYKNSIIFTPDTLSQGASYNAYLIKYNSVGKVIWARQPLANVGGNSDCSDVVVDSSGNVYITGYFQTGRQFGPYVLTSPGSSTSTFFVKYDSNGNVLWAKAPLLNSQYCRAFAYSLAIDGKGYLYMTGTFIDTVSFGAVKITSPTFTWLSTASNAFIAKYDENGNV
ncbi:MAG TPA: SBBP repeat-containing protein, partial [Bacteroidia bacterium]|nr:SBBP repeat-containing protein [Bacteroidia bacterium]